MDDLWVFGYGSLMWRPGFAFEEAHVAVLEGYHRSLCVYSYVYRGTPEKPGLVLGLARGGESIGMAFRAAGENRDAVIAYLREREQVTSVYLEETGTVRFLTGDRMGDDVLALTYVADPAHEQYAGKLSIEEQKRIVLAGEGKAGPNIDYVLNTVDHLKDIDIDDPELFALAEGLRANGG
ncbi:cation transport protein ChaC [Cohaesibacter sp. ES.047]|uniref:gamma-glutamylcyclotransferase n=1 Tax=Cohaesibacter sp. ES.047 TaxID=1798205 RepID=UPI000BB69C79|nr:gamma-glutamylcyclotransferase [Cohaesibacter sp. ES.047]SNY90801.1 cation transport protein ChaC [Cohaesibacter sp. ES.047]